MSNVYCPLALKYDYSNMVDSNQPFANDLYGSADNGVEYSLDFSSGHTAVTHIGTNDFTATGFNNFDPDSDSYRLEFSVRLINIGASISYVSYGLFAAGNCYYGIEFGYEPTSNRVAILFLQHGSAVGSVYYDNSAIGNIYKLKYERQGNGVYVYINDAYYAVDTYNDTFHGSISPADPQLKFDGVDIAEVQVWDISAVSNTQGTQCTLLAPSCQAGLKYDYSPLTSMNDPFLDYWYASVFYLSNYAFHFINGSVLIWWYSSGYKLINYNSAFGQVDATNDYTIEIKVTPRNINASSSSIWQQIGLCDSSDNTLYGLALAQSNSGDTMYIGFLNASNLITGGYWSETSATDNEYKCTFKRIGNIAYGYVNDVLIGSAPYDDSEHVNIGNSGLVGWQAVGVSSTQVQFRDLFVVSTTQNYDCGFLMSSDCQTTIVGRKVYFDTAGIGTTYLWSFGDGTTSSSASSWHVYTKAGSYTVSLSIDGLSGTLDYDIVVFEKSFFIDAGAVYVNYGESGQFLLGTTEGGNQFGIDQDVRYMTFDGHAGQLATAHRIVNSVPKIICNIISIDYRVLNLMLPGSDISFADGSVAISRKIRKLLTEDYIKNIAIVGEHGGTGCIVVCKILNAVQLEDIEIPFEDSKESVIQLTFSGCFAIGNLDDESWQIDFITNQ